MGSISNIISQAKALRDEKRPASITPERIGALMEDTLKYIAELESKVTQLESKISTLSFDIDEDTMELVMKHDGINE